MPAQKLKKFLDSRKIKYVTITHSLAYTAQAIAASAHIAGKELAKTVMVKINDKMAMAVLPASHKVNFDRLKKTARASKVQLPVSRNLGTCFLSQRSELCHLSEIFMGWKCSWTKFYPKTRRLHLTPVLTRSFRGGRRAA